MAKTDNKELQYFYLTLHKVDGHVVEHVISPIAPTKESIASTRPKKKRRRKHTDGSTNASIQNFQNVIKGLSR